MLFKNIFLSTILILIVCLAIWANVVNDKRDVIVYEDLNYLTLNYIDLDSLKINLVENKFIIDSLFNQEFSFIKLEKHLENIDYFNNSNVYRTVDSKINLQINEKDAVMFLEYQNRYVDSEGKMIPLSKIYSPETVYFVGQIDSVNLINALEVSSKIKSDDFLNGHIDYIFLDSIQMNLKPVNENFLINFGNFNRISSKLKKYKIFYAAKYKSDLFSTVKNINLSFKNQVVIEKLKQ
tara:strand:- start:1282 stop:1992 length:711 start_codon:yes stop_codon:yes gene_type:complete